MLRYLAPGAQDMRERISLGVSVLALLISGLTYYSSVQTKDSLLFRLVESDMTERGGTAVTAKFVFSNNGNRPYLISQVQVVVAYGQESGTSSPSADQVLSAATPFVLDEGQMRVVDSLTLVAEMSPRTLQPMPVHLLAKIIAVDVDGQLHQSEVLFASTCLRSGMLIGGDARGRKVSLSDGSSKESRPNPCLE